MLTPRHWEDRKIFEKGKYKRGNCFMTMQFQNGGGITRSDQMWGISCVIRNQVVPGSQMETVSILAERKSKKHPQWGVGESGPECRQTAGHKQGLWRRRSTLLRIGTLWQEKLQSQGMLLSLHQRGLPTSVLATRSHVVWGLYASASFIWKMTNQLWCLGTLLSENYPIYVFFSPCSHTSCPPLFGLLRLREDWRNLLLLISSIMRSSFLTVWSQVKQ